MKTTRFFLGIALCLSAIMAWAQTHEIYWTIDYKTVQFAASPVRGLAINGRIPGPLLHFQEGDRVRIHVTNHLREETAMHWHGLLVPWQMDGVLGVSQRGIQPGATFVYDFSLLQSGTYWYHAHAGLQEQRGLYGGLVIDPKQARKEPEFTLLFSDWSQTHPERILANLKKAGDYYAPRFPLQSSLWTFLHDWKAADAVERKQVLADYRMMQSMRMGLYDINDIAYDAFLLNGQTKKNPWVGHVRLGQTVRLRLIGAGANTMFRVKIPGSMMEVVAVEGNAVKPYSVETLLITPGETWEVRLRIQEKKPYVIYAESADTVGAVWGVLMAREGKVPEIQISDHPPATGTLADTVWIMPFPRPKPVTREMMDNMMRTQGGEAGHAMHHGMHHSMMGSMQHTMPMEPSVYTDRIIPARGDAHTTPDLKYQALHAAYPTNDPTKQVAGEIHMELFGYMDRYIWFINGEPEYRAKPIVLAPGKRYRIVLKNATMMHHPMHMHGHWFIVRQGYGAYDPLLHTIDMAPGATVVADVDTDASGQWLFHCHFLYHMMSGMTRIFQYQSLISLVDQRSKPQDMVHRTVYRNRPIVRVDTLRPVDVSLVRHPMPHHMPLWFSHAVEFGQDIRHAAQQITYKGLYGADFNKFEILAREAEFQQGRVENLDADFFYWHALSQFWAAKGGLNYHNRPGLHPYWQPGIGMEGLMPWFIAIDARAYYYSGAAQLDIIAERDTQITDNFFVGFQVRGMMSSKSLPSAAIHTGLYTREWSVRPYYRLIPGLSLFAEFEQTHRDDAILSSDMAAVENAVRLGFSVLL